SDKPRYKSEIKRKIENNLDRCPIDSSFSVQTVSRRTTELEERGLVDPTIIKSNKTNRIFVKAYEVTERGLTHLNEFRKRFLLNTAYEYVNSQVRSDKKKPQVDELAIKEMACTLFDIPLDEDLGGPECILPAVFLYHSRREIQRKIDRPEFQEFTDRIRNQGTDLIQGPNQGGIEL
ncbi:MAG: hypothetical protein SVV03_03005, partial [Candidatus Nanohaloarchaea archaeon]|nr:hypothetical protein [Candidatus Nanohaloarchaea archaeon]